MSTAEDGRTSATGPVLVGQQCGQRIVFSWRWPDVPTLRGVGYWELDGDMLSGRWYYQEEADFTLADLVAEPSLINADVEVRTLEDRDWTLERIE
jgi:hypothetical protein